MPGTKHRIVVAKPGLDGHDRGAKVVARALRDAGFEVIYTGLHQTAEQIAEAVIQEDADAVGLSIHSGAHMTLFPKVASMLKERGATDVVIFGGGIIPKEDIPLLEEKGIEKIFTPGAPTTEIVEWLRNRLEKGKLMDLFEYQGKEIFAKHGLPLLDAEVVQSAEQARAAAEGLGGGAVVKVQVQVGGRGKGGGIVIAKTPQEAEAAARTMFEQGFNGMPVTRVLVESLADIESEFYMAITLDRSSKGYVAMTSSEGGVDIEEVAHSKPESIRRARIDPLLGLRAYQTRRLVGALPEPAREGAAAVLATLWEVVQAEDATLVEVNPLVLLGDGRVVPLDAKITVDDNALFRHPETAEYASAFVLDPTEARAREKGLQYVKLDGEVGIIGNGAGLVMATLDVVQQAGGAAANFLDVGGGASADVMATSLEVILSDPAVRSVLVNIFGGITRGDLVAKGIVEALQRVEATVPIVVRLDGTNAEEGRKILTEAGHEKIVPEETMLGAAKRAVELAGKAA